MYSKKAKDTRTSLVKDISFSLYLESLLRLVLEHLHGYNYKSMHQSSFLCQNVFKCSKTNQHSAASKLLNLEWGRRHLAEPR